MDHATPDQHLTIFENLDSAYIHVVIPVELAHFRSYFQKAKDMLFEDSQRLWNAKAYHDKQYYDNNLNQIHELLFRPTTNSKVAAAAGISIAHRIDSIIAQFDNITALLPQQVEKHTAITFLSLQQPCSLEVSWVPSSECIPRKSSIPST